MSLLYNVRGFSKIVSKQLELLSPHLKHIPMLLQGFAYFHPQHENSHSNSRPLAQCYYLSDLQIIMNEHTCMVSYMAYHVFCI